MSIFLAKAVTKGSPPTPPFLTRNIDNYTQSKPSDLTIFAKPTNVQLAYAGYQKNFEAFLFATESGKKIFCSLEEYPISTGYSPSVPIKYPPIVFRAASRDPKLLEKIRGVIKPMGGKEEKLGKGNPCFTIANPSFKAARLGIRTICAPQSPFLALHASAQSAYWAARLHQLVDLFLRVQTYENKGIEEERFHKRYTNISNSKLMQSGDLSKDIGAAIKRRKLNDKGKYDMEDINTFPLIYGDEEKKVWTDLRPEEAVLHAKPSVHKSSYNYGSPSDVPKKPGRFFPYFDGMIIPDTTFIRDVVSEIFFRNLGADGTSCKDAWKQFRTDIATYSQTQSGMEMTHILAGCRLALHGQARLFLVFDEDSYKGFCLLGSEFHLYIGRSCLDPLPSDELVKILADVATRSGSASMLKIVAESQAGWPLGEEIEVEKLMESSRYVAEVLVKLQALELGEDDMKTVTRSLAHLHFQKKFLSFSPTNIKDSLIEIADLTFEGRGPSSDRPFYIPLKGWSHLGDPIYQILARFGPNSISFFNSKGVRYPIPKEIGSVNSTVFQPAATQQRIFVYEKPVQTCVVEMMKVIRGGEIWQDEAERAGGQRAHVFNQTERVTIAEGLTELHTHWAFEQLPVGKAKEEVKEGFKVVDAAEGFDESLF
jgi:hypothetical protein